MYLRKFVSLLAIGLFTLANADPDGLQVSTQAGAVIGTLAIPTVRQWLGIPYAVAKRWQAPIQAPKFNKPFSATNFSTVCPQNFDAGDVEFLRVVGLTDAQIFLPESETCQTINIWAPSVKRKQKTAVMGVFTLFGHVSH
jgi:carboxylesterase type B